MSILELYIITKRLINKINELLEPELKLNTRDDKEYKIKAICNNKIYTKEATRKLLELYYLVF